MAKFIVDVKRDGYNPKTDCSVTIYGTFPIKAASLAQAKVWAAKVMETLQTIDPLVDWQSEMPKNFSYVDYTFEIENVIADEYDL